MGQLSNLWVWMYWTEYLCWILRCRRKLIFLIDNKGAWDSFVAGKTRFSGSASATASDGVNGGSYEGAAYVADGVWMYQMTKKGLALEASIGGTKIYPDKELNQY